MKFVSIRDLRSQPGLVWKRLEDDEVVLTANGRPMALMTRVDEDEIEPLLREIRLARMRLTIARLQAQAARSDARDVDEKGVEELVAKTRAARSR